MTGTVSTEVILNDEQDNGFQDGFLNNVYFMYACIQKPNHNKEENKDSYEVKCVISEDAKTPYKDIFKGNNKVYEIPTEKFKDTFKCDAPFPDQDNQYYIRLAVDVNDQNGEPLAYEAFKRPKVSMIDADGDIEDVTMKTLVGNGSFGHVAFYVAPWKNKIYPKMTEILVVDLVEYVERSGGGGSAFGNRKKENIAKDSSFAKPTEKGVTPSLDEDDEDF